MNHLRVADLTERCLINHPEVPLHEFAQSVFRLIADVSAQEFGVIGDHRFNWIMPAAAQTEQLFARLFLPALLSHST